jgi:tetratricopeptide (TPR) repeat protein
MTFFSKRQINLIFLVLYLFLISGCFPVRSFQTTTIQKPQVQEPADQNPLSDKYSIIEEEGWELFRKGDFENAISKFKQSLSITETDTKYHGIGESYFYLKNYHEAISNFEKATNFLNSPLYLKRIGDSYYQLENYKSAIANYSEAESIADEDQRKGIKFSHAYALIAIEDYKKAYEILGNRNTLGVAIKDNTEGIEIESVFKNGPADLSALKSGDILVEFNGISLKGKNSKEFIELVQEPDFGSSILIRILRDGTVIEKVQPIGISPDIYESYKFNTAYNHVASKNYDKAYEILGNKNTIGVKIKDSTQGIEVDSVFRNGPADLAEIRSGDILVEFNGVSLKGKKSSEFVELVQKPVFGSSIKVNINRNGYIIERSLIVGIPRNLEYLIGKNKTNLSFLKGQSGHNKKQTIFTNKEIEGQYWAILIGISEYKDSRIPSLRYASKDADKFYNWLVNTSGGKYAPSRVKLLINESATLNNIKNALFIWLKQALEEDVVLLYFAGHGSPESPDTPNNLFFLPAF